ncbi:MAG: 2-C-methyl-D-erythritol 2,4-cyclodiphosphate synthase [Bacteroidales bacterium]|nr:2-C-methyl-D-erythritol 2,4-cyclodiphosphate synthase [Bacteroidales bacterium]
MINYRIGTGFDVHRLVKERPLILGGVHIPHEKGCLGHSDADVLVHAICDALLGALALGDIGSHFPDTDDKWKDSSSLILLSKVQTLIRKEGFKIGNIDATLIIQKPKIAEYRMEMRRKIADLLELSIDQISVKATSTEGLGFEGREEGISAQAVCILHKV